MTDLRDLEIELLQRENRQLREALERIALDSQRTLSERVLAKGRPAEEPPPPLPVGEAPLDMALVIYDRPKSRNAAIGAPKALMIYAEHAQREGRLRVELIKGEEIESSAKVRRKLQRARSVVVNGLQAFLWDSAFEVADLNPNTWFYLHETEWVWSVSAQRMPERYERVTQALHRNGLLASTEKQRRWFEDLLAPRRSAVVYNCVDFVPRLELTTPPARRDRKRIMMVGSMQPRKGVALFSSVADLAAARGLPYDFIWVGDTGTDSIHFDRSENATWLGRARGTELHWLLNAADLFFLSSEDDPLPLVVSEALSAGVGCSVYEETGSEEMVRGVTGCSVFKTYDAESALAAIQKAIDNPVDPETAHAVAEKFTSVTAFAHRIESAVLSR